MTEDERAVSPRAPAAQPLGRRRAGLYHRQGGHDRLGPVRVVRWLAEKARNGEMILKRKHLIAFALLAAVTDISVYRLIVGVAEYMNTPARCHTFDCQRF